MIPFYKNHFDVSDLDSVMKVLQRQKDWANGPEIEEFETSLCDYLGAKHVTLFNSGTSALHAAMILLKIGPGDKVVIPSFTFIAVANAVRFVGAEPVFIDIDLTSYSIDPELLKELLDQGKKIKAVIYPYFAGIPGPLEDIYKICKNHHVKLIEDASEAIGLRLSPKTMAGTVGHVAILSFAANKMISCGEGGACVVNDEKIDLELKKIRSHGRTSDINYFRSSLKSEYVRIGYNWRMSSMAAALGNSQLKRIENVIEQRRSIAKYYNKHLDARIVRVPENKEAAELCTYQFYCIELQSKEQRTDLMKRFEEKNIGVNIYFRPIHTYKTFKDPVDPNYNSDKLLKTNNLASKILSLPCYPGMTQSQQDEVIDIINSYLSDF